MDTYYYLSGSLLRVGVAPLLSASPKLCQFQIFILQKKYDN